MIVSFRDDWLRVFFVDDIRSKKIPPDLESRLFRKLQMIDDATTDQDLRIPPSNHFEKLRGDLEGLHSIRVNKQWRLIFQWVGAKGEASNVYLFMRRGSILLCTGLFLQIWERRPGFHQPNWFRRRGGLAPAWKLVKQARCALF